MLGGWCAGRRRFLWSLESNRKQKKLIHKGFQSLRGKRAFFRALNATNTSFSASISFTKLSGKTPCLPPNSPIHQPASAQSWMTQIQMSEFVRSLFREADSHPGQRFPPWWWCWWYLPLLGSAHLHFELRMGKALYTAPALTHKMTTVMSKRAEQKQQLVRWSEH